MRILAPVLALLLVAPACSQDGPREQLATTAQKLAEIRSGELSLRASVENEGPGAGFELSGVFELPGEEGSLPVASIDYTQIAGDEQAQSAFVSDGEAACVKVADGYQQLSAEQLELLQGSVGSSSETDGALQQLGIEDWIEGEASMEEDDGSRTFTSSLNVPAAIGDIVELTQSYGASSGLEPLDEAGTEQIENAVQSSLLEVEASSETDHLERLFVEVEFGTEEQYRELLGELASATFSLEMTLSNHNEDIEVSLPPCTPAP